MAFKGYSESEVRSKTRNFTKGQTLVSKFLSAKVKDTKVARGNR